MSNFEKFGKFFNSEKVKTWDNDYINYNGLITEIKGLMEFQKKIIKENPNNILSLSKSTIIESNEIIRDLNKTGSNEKSSEISENIKGVSNPLSFIINKSHSLQDKEEKGNLILNKGIYKDISFNNQIDEIKTQIKEKIKAFINELDKEVKKIYIFYSSKEKEIYQKINKKIINKNNLSDKNPSELIKELNSLNYISELCKQIIIYIFLNIKALKNILFIFDKSTTNIVESLSYIYLKKYLSKNNSDLIYILNFKTLDETIFTVEEISEEIKNIINKNNDYRKNEEQKNNFKNIQDEIESNIDNYNKTHERIFSELSEWKSFLNTNLEFPTSSYNSVFRKTSLIGDYVPSLFGKINNDNEDLLNYDSQVYDEGEDDSMNDEFCLFTFNKKEKKILKQYQIKLESSLFNDNVSFTKKKKILSKENKKNLLLIYFLVFFYSFSYCIIIPLLNERKIIKFSDDNEKKIEYSHFYGLIITIPFLGNLFSLIYLNELIKYKYILALFLSTIFILIYYLILICGMIIFYMKEKINNATICLLLISRFLLGLSSLRIMCKEYINIFIPNESQIKANQNYLKSSYCGYIIGFLLIGLQNFSSEGKTFNYTLTALFAISCFFAIFLCFQILKLFRDPKNKDFRTFRASYAMKKKTNMITSNLSLFLDQNEKKIVEKQENYFENANKLALLAGVNYLSEESYNLEKMQKKYFNKILMPLIVLLLTSEYTSENVLLFLPIININDDNNKNYQYGLFTNSLSYLISIILQSMLLKIISQKNLNIKILIILSIISLIIICLLFFDILLEEFSLEYFCFISNSLMIIISDFYRIITVNLFLGLLPDENFTFLCMKPNIFIVLINKLLRLIPGVIIIFNYLSDDNNKLKYFGINLGFNEVLFIFSFIYLIYFRKLKSNSLTRLVNSSN